MSWDVNMACFNFLENLSPGNINILFSSCKTSSHYRGSWEFMRVVKTLPPLDSLQVISSCDIRIKMLFIE